MLFIYVNKIMLKKKKKRKKKVDRVDGRKSPHSRYILENQNIEIYIIYQELFNRGTSLVKYSTLSDLTILSKKSNATRL